MLTQQDIMLVRKSWRMMYGIDAQLVGGTFYARLFSEKPALRRLFPADIQAQHSKLMDMLHSMVTHLHRMDKLEDDLLQVAGRHVGYGVKPEHYPLAGEALLWTLSRALGRDWTPETAAAWERACASITRLMLKAHAKAGRQ